MKTRLSTAMKLLAQYLAGSFGILATGTVCVALLTWEFCKAVWSVVILGRNEGDLL